MSDLVVQPVKIDAIKPHPNADRLSIAIVGGWEVVVGKDNHRVGDTVVHVQPDSMVPRQWAQAWGVEQYLSFKKGQDMGRVRAARLRSVTSFGFLAPNDTQATPGTDLADHYGIRKYEPPPPPVGMSAGQMHKQHTLFHIYTDIQNLRNFSDKLCYSEPLIVTEKIHGTNSRVGWVRRIKNNNHQSHCLMEQAWDIPEAYCTCEEYELAVGTHRTQRQPEDCGVYGLPLQLHKDVLENVFKKIQEWFEGEIKSVIFFGEIYGAGVQDLHYGQKQEKGYRVFDIAVNGNYVPWTTLEYLQEQCGLPLVPVLDRGVFDFETLIKLAQGNTTLGDTHCREGIVVRPLCYEKTWGKGEQDPNPKRMIFKVISDSYLLRKEGTEYH